MGDQRLCVSAYCMYFESKEGKILKQQKPRTTLQLFTLCCAQLHYSVSYSTFILRLVLHSQGENIKIKNFWKCPDENTKCKEPELYGTLDDKDV